MKISKLKNKRVKTQLKYNFDEILQIWCFSHFVDLMKIYGKTEGNNFVEYQISYSQIYWFLNLIHG